MIITDAYIDDIKIPLSEEINNNIDNENTFTILIGKNGTGKSSILSKIATTYIKAQENNSGKKRVDRGSKKVFSFLSKRKFSVHTSSSGNGFITSDDNNRIYAKKHLFKKCICVSTSPFDKFPIKGIEDFKEENYYHYIGLKKTDDSYTKENLIKFLANTILTGNSRTKLEKVFETLDYENEVILKFQKAITQNLTTLKDRNIIDVWSKSSKTFNQMIDIENDLFRSHLRKLLIHDYKSIRDGKDIYRNNSYFETLSQLSEIPTSFSFNMKNNLNKIQPEKIKNLLNNQLVKVTNVILKKHKTNKTIDLSVASSGEQSLLLTLLCIASVIDDDCLICIDEPEISLHPEWQQIFMTLLSEMFSDYRGCHFIIATHSPLITSNIQSKNAFILQTDTNELESADVFQGRSSDYQLAMLFKTPGHRNEYLINEIVQIMSKLSLSIEISSELQSRIDRVLSLKNKISEKDPIHDLISTIEKAINVSK